MNGDWKPTGRLRFVSRLENPHSEVPRKILQQWYALDVPAYMLGTEGEWRDVALESETL
jgi:hypothetical protein